MKLMLQQLRATAKEDPALAADSVEMVTKIVLEQIDALSRIASDFSAFARFPKRTMVEINVNHLLASVCALYGVGDEAGSTVEAELADELPPVRWDADELRRVFVNVVANAVQSLDEAKGAVHVVVRSAPATVPGSGREGCVVTVTDDGVGIPPENRARLFEPEFSTKRSGTGLGLAIVKRILTDLGGEIAIESEPGRGTVVSIWLPRSDPQAPPLHATPYPFASTPALPLPPTSATPP
jgi:signal transduction histidine kinase